MKCLAVQPLSRASCVTSSREANSTSYRVLAIPDAEAFHATHVAVAVADRHFCFALLVESRHIDFGTGSGMDARKHEVAPRKLAAGIANVTC